MDRKWHGRVAVGMTSAEISRAEMQTPSVDGSLSARLLPFVLSLVAGSADAIAFFGLGGLFVAHVTGNLVILAAQLVSGGEAQVAQILSLPAFIAILALTKLLATGLERMRIATLGPLLLLQFLLLAGFLAVCVAAGPTTDPNAPSVTVAGLLGVAAMAVQNALVQVSLTGAPATAVMTTNITRFILDLGEIMFGVDPDGRAKARDRAKCTWPAILGFAIGCGLGAACQRIVGLWSLTLPGGLALLAFLMGISIEAGRRR
jgi:uncharacterized membrane protein YoaK (UPF0700 family)